MDNVSDVTPLEAWELLKSDPKVQLVDGTGSCASIGLFPSARTGILGGWAPGRMCGEANGST